MRNAMPFYECRDGIYEIDEYGCSEVFVIVGTKSALVVDTGTGIGELRHLIETEITDKPYDVVATHNHVDHIGGAGWIDRIYMHSADIAHADPIFPPTWEARKKYAEIIRQNGNNSQAYQEQDIRPWPGTPEFVPLEDGQKFDLGGRTVTVWHCPGHTAGEIVLLDDRTRTLLCGDAFNCNWLFDTSGFGAPLESAQRALSAMKRIYNMRDQYDVVYNSHHDFREFGFPLSPDVIPNLIECLEQMLSRAAEIKETPDVLNPGKNKKIAVNKNVFITYMSGDIEVFGK